MGLGFDRSRGMPAEAWATAQRLSARERATWVGVRVEVGVRVGVGVRVRVRVGLGLGPGLGPGLKLRGRP